MDMLTEHINLLIPYTNRHGVDLVWVVVGEDTGFLQIMDGICVEQEDAHLLAMEASEKNPEARFWIQQIVLGGPALERVSSKGTTLEQVQKHLEALDARAKVNE